MPFATTTREIGKLATSPQLVIIIGTQEQAEIIVKTSVLLLLLIINTLGNVGVVVIVIKDRELRITPRMLTLASLALTDLFMILVIIFKISTLYNDNTSKISCNTFGTIFAVFLHVCILHLFVLSVDSYIAVFYPLSYRQIVTTKRLGLALAVMWLICLITIALQPLFMKESSDLRIQSFIYSCTGFSGDKVDPRYRTFVYSHASILFIMPLTCMLIMYHKIAKVSRYQSNRVDVLERGTMPFRRSRLREMKWAKTIGLVIGAFTACYVPIIVMILYQASFGPESAMSTAILYLAFINTAINPVVYSLRSREHRRALLKIFKRNNTIYPESGQVFSGTQVSHEAPTMEMSRILENGRRENSLCTESTTTSSSFSIFSPLYATPTTLEKVLRDAIKAVYCNEVNLNDD